MEYVEVFFKSAAISPFIYEWHQLKHQLHFKSLFCYCFVEFSSEGKSSLSIQLIQRLVYTAAKVDAWWLIKIIFNLPAGRIVFDSYKSRSLLPEYVAIANGHKEIAQYLQDVTKRYKLINLLTSGVLREVCISHLP